MRYNVNPPRFSILQELPLVIIRMLGLGRRERERESQSRALRAPQSTSSTTSYQRFEIYPTHLLNDRRDRRETAHVSLTAPSIISSYKQAHYNPSSPPPTSLAQTLEYHISKIYLGTSGPTNYLRTGIPRITINFTNDASYSFCLLLLQDQLLVLCFSQPLDLCI